MDEWNDLDAATTYSIKIQSNNTQSGLMRVLYHSRLLCNGDELCPCINLLYMKSHKCKRQYKRQELKSGEKYKREYNGMGGGELRRIII